MSRKKNMAMVMAGVLAGTMLTGPAVHAAEAYLKAYRSNHTIYLDGEQIQLEAYTINGSNYVKLRDIGKEVGFNVYWDDGVQIDSDASYTGIKPKAAAPQSTQDVAAYYSARVETVERINALRRTNGQAALKMDDDLMAAAQVRAEEIAATKAYRHTRPDGSDNDTVLIHTGKLRMGENLGAKDSNGSVTLAKLPQVQVDSWSNSEAHFKNMLHSHYHSMGVGIAKDSYGMFFVALLLGSGDYIVTGIDAPIIS